MWEEAMKCKECGGTEFRKTRMLTGFSEGVEFYVCKKCDYIGDLVVEGEKV